MDDGIHDVTPKGTITPLGHPRTGGDRPLNCCNGGGGGKDAPTSTSVRQPSRHHRPCLIPAWPARGIFAGGSFATRCGDAGSRKRRRKGSVNVHLERLLGDEVRQCDVCARAVLWTRGLERRYFSANKRADDDGPSEKSVAESLPRLIERHISSASPLPCSFCTSDQRRRRWCGAVYCSDDCRTMGEEAVAFQTPSMPVNAATEPTDASLPPPKLFFCRNRFFRAVELQEGKIEELDGLVEEATDSIEAIETRFRSICGYDDANADTDTRVLGVEECALLLATILSCVCTDMMSITMQPMVNQSLQNINSDEEGLIEEMWATARAHASVYQELLKKWSGSGTAKSQPFPSYQAFAQWYLDIKRSCLLRVDAPTHPLAAYATKTIISKDALTEEERSSALDMLKYSWLAPDDNEITGGEARDTQSAILRWRRAAHFAHWASNPTTSSDPESKSVQALLRKSYFAHCPSIRDTEHSCAPTLMLTIPDSSTGEQSSKSPLDRLSWLALHDVPKGGASISKLDSLEGDAAVRSADFVRLMGKGCICSCVRCRYESQSGAGDAVCLKDGADSGSSVGAIRFTRCKLKRLADQAMQQGRFEDASNLYSIILRAHPKDGDVLHARAASYLGRASSLPFADIGHYQGHFVKAQRLWDEAGLIEECSSHPEIAVQVAKQRVYKTNQHMNGGETANGGAIAFTNHLDGKCFVTSDPVIPPEECQRAIKSAEEHATKSSGGWTTSRHYAVPTTDIPIHELTSLHPWFCNLWDATIRPLLRQQFQLDKPPQRDIFLHDAFLVRYDAERQRYLPPHVDESTHSFILALNDGFEGGGTYFHCLGKTLAPSVGGMVSFCGGEVLHSGDPVVSGTRYVIAAFCYIDLAGSGADASSEKPPNLKGVFSQGKGRDAEDKGQGNSFSFGFGIDG